MRESPRDLARLQELLDDSYERAGAHLRSIITPARRLTAEQVCGELTGMTLLALATVTSACRPIVSPVDGVLYQGVFWFGSSPDSFRFRHIRQNPNVSATHTRGEELVVTVHGIAHVIDTSARATGEYDGLKEAYREVYGPTWDTWGYWEGAAPYAYIEPRAMFAASFKGIDEAQAV